MRNIPRPSLNRSNDGGVALKVLVLKLPNLFGSPANYFVQIFQQIMNNNHRSRNKVIFFAKHLAGNMSDQWLFFGLCNSITPICLKIPILTKLDIDMSLKNYH